MTAVENLKSTRIRPSFLFGLGAHLAGNGLLVFAIYYLVMEVSAQQARDLLDWVVPLAQGCCLFAAISLAAGLSARESQESGREQTSWRRWMIMKVMPFGHAAQQVPGPVAVVDRAPSAAEVERALRMVKAVDWKVFKNLGIGYFRELGFRVLDQPNRARGVDFLLYTEADYNVAAVRCLPWGTDRVDLKAVREFHRAMMLAGASQGVVLTTGQFEEDATDFGEGNGLELLGGSDFVLKLLSLPPDTSDKLLSEADAAEKIREEGKEGKGDRLKAPVESKGWF